MTFPLNREYVIERLLLANFARSPGRCKAPFKRRVYVEINRNWLYGDSWNPLRAIDLFPMHEIKTAMTLQTLRDFTVRYIVRILL